MAHSVKSFVCSSCGAQLDLNSGKGNQVQCKYCGTINMLENITKNNEIIEKQNINSGMMLNAEKVTLHQRIVEILANEEAAPLDVFQKAKIIKEDHICVPFFLFMVSGTGQFSYELGQQRQNTVVENNSLVTKTYTEWTPFSSSVSCSETFFVCGNKEFKDTFNQFPDYITTSALIDIEELDLPSDVEMYNFNYPQAAAFNEQVRPRVTALLKDMAERTLVGKNTRNGMLQGDNAHQDEMQRIFVPFYRVLVSYGDNVKTVYINNDGRYCVHNGGFVDPARQAEIEAQKSAIDSVKPASKAIWTALLVASIVLSAILLIACKGGLKALALLPVAGIVFALIKKSSINKDYEARRSAEIAKLNQIKAPFEDAKEEFYNNQRALGGIYESIVRS